MFEWVGRAEFEISHRETGQALPALPGELPLLSQKIIHDAFEVEDQKRGKQKPRLVAEGTTQLKPKSNTY